MAVASSRSNVRRIAQLEAEAHANRTWGQRAGLAVTRLTGNPAFAVGNAAVFLLWILINISAVPGVAPFDPFPFNFLTLIVSLEAIFLSIFVLVSQNQVMRDADRRAHLNLQVDLLAEQELTILLRMLRGLCIKHDVDTGVPPDALRAVLEETDLQSLAADLEHAMPRS